jgi:hypothetical protein
MSAPAPANVAGCGKGGAVKIRGRHTSIVMTSCSIVCWVNL